VVGAIIAGALLTLAVSGAMLSPVLLGWPPPDRPTVAPPLVTSPATPQVGATTAVSTPSPRAASATPSPSRSPKSTTRPPAPPAPVPTGFDGLESQVFALTNSERAEKGCPALRLDAKLRTAARAHSADMARNHYFSHTSPDGRDPGKRMADAGYDISRGWAENIARGYPTAQAVMRGWMNSTGHRANILNCDLRALGVGVARVGNGQLHWTQDFGGR